MIPGQNTLNQALSVLASQTFLYYRFLSRVISASGKFQGTYQAAVAVSGMIQPVPRNLYEQLGLDFSKNYITAFVSYDMVGPERDGMADFIKWNGSWWQIESPTDWLAIDGWKSYMCVRVPEGPVVE